MMFLMSKILGTLAPWFLMYLLGQPSKNTKEKLTLDVPLLLQGGMRRAPGNWIDSGKCVLGRM